MPTEPAPEPTPREQIDALEAHRAERREATTAAIATSSQRELVEPTGSVRIDGEWVTGAPVDPAKRDAFVTAYRERKAAATAKRAESTAELDAFIAADELERARKWQPDERAALERRARTASPI